MFELLDNTFILFIIIFGVGISIGVIGDAIKRKRQK